MRNLKVLLILILFLGLWNFVLNFDINHTGFATVEDDATNPNDDFRPYIGIAVVALFIYLNWKYKKRDEDLETEIYKKPEDQAAVKEAPKDDGETSELTKEEMDEVEKEARKEIEEENKEKKKAEAKEAAKKKIKAEMKEDQE